MPLGTLDRSPPPFFRQGPSAITKLALATALSVFLMAADARFQLVVPVRAAIATALLPVQQTLQAGVDIVTGGGGYLRGLQQAQSAEAEARRELAALAEKSARADTLAIENARLRDLLALSPAIVARSQAAEVMYQAADPYALKLVIDRGRTQGVRPGAPVIDPRGVLGQVTRVYPLTAEVTLLSDRDAAIPVLNQRTQQSGVAYGGVQGADGARMELRFVSANNDVQAGDRLETSGLDGVYPPGLAVATVVSVERRSEGGFARVLLAPAAQSEGVRHVLVLEPLKVQRDEGSAAGSATETPTEKPTEMPTDTAASSPAKPARAATAAAVPASAAERARP
jgi:rod shape-determining protein MreC